MKILLVKPYNVSDHIQPSQGLGYLATAVRKTHEVKILDCIKEGVTAQKFARIIRRERPDVVGIQCYTFDLKFVDETLKAVKGQSAETVTMVGGPHPSAAPMEMMEHFATTLDYLFVGEAEVGLPRLLTALQEGRKDLSDIPGLVYRKDGMVTKNPQLFVDDLDSLGLPAWDLIRPETYPESQHGAFFKKFPIAPIIVTRGCPYSCTFCAGCVVSGKRVRRRSAGHVLSEISYLYHDFGIREFHVIDDNFTMDPLYAKDLLRQLKELRLDISWAVPNGVRMDTLDDELLALMKETGLYMISLGIESGSDRILKAMKKGITTAKVRECVARIHRAGIEMSGFFILGFPGETEETMRQTIEFSLELPLSRANFFTYLPFPGSESYAQLQERGELAEVDWRHFYFMNAAYTPQGLTRKRLKHLQRSAFARFYFRPRIFLSHIRAIQSPRHFFFLARRVFRWTMLG